MAIEKKLIHFKNFSDFNSKKLSANENNTQYTLGVDGEVQTGSPDILYQSICWIKDVKKIWTHGQYYDCNGDNGTSDSPTFLRIGDFDDEAKANFIAVANGEKSADYYICASSIQGAETNGIVSSLDYSGPTGAPEIVDYTFYGTPMHGSKQYKLLKITTTLTVSTGVITTTYKDVLDAKQDTITDLENIREGASKGATSVQPDDISEFITVEDVATVATSGSYEDLTDKPVYITDFDVLSLYNLAQNIDEVGSIQSDKQAIINALAANKIVLVPYEISDNISCRGYATLVGYVEDLLYFKVITDIDEIIVETLLDQADIYGQEVTLREWYSKQDQLVSGTNIKTIDGQSILGEGDLTIEGGAKVYTWNWDGSESGTLTQEEYDGINEADVVYVNSMDSSTVSMVKAEYNDGHISLDMSTGIDLGGGEQGLVSVVIDILPDLTYFSKTGIYPITTHTSQLINDSNFVDSSNLKTINGQSLVGTGDIVIGGGEDIRYFTEFTLSDFIRACNKADTLTSAGLYNAIINNKIICIPSGGDSGYTIVRSLYVAPNPENGGSDNTFEISLEYNQSTYLASLATNDLESDILEGSVVSKCSRIIYLNDPIEEWSDNCIYYIRNAVDELTIVFSGSYGTTIRFKTGENTVITFYANAVLWPNGVMPEIEPHTSYELSLCSNINDDVNAVLVPFKSV